jgi:hypothetical protein
MRFQHRRTVSPGTRVWIGSTISDTELLFVLRDAGESAASGSFENSMVDALAATLVSRREVTAFHGDTDGRVTSLRIDPA